MKIRNLKFWFLFFLLAIGLSGCLTVEKKIYKITLNSDGSGTMTVIYKNIFSQSEDGETKNSPDEVDQDFNELISNYLLSNDELMENVSSNVTIVEKKLYVKRGELYGKVVYKFSNYEDIGLYKAKDCPYYFFRFTGDEVFDKGNCSYDENLGLVVWDSKLKKLKLETNVSEFTKYDTKLAKSWKKFH